MDNTHLFRLIGSIARQSTSVINQTVKEYGLDNNLFLYLMRIVENEGISQVDLSNKVKVDKTTLSRAIHKLENDKYIIKLANQENKKFNKLYPTDKATEIYKVLIVLENNYIDNALKNLNQTELNIVTEILQKIDSTL